MFEWISAQSKDVFCLKALLLDGLPGSASTFDKNGLLVGKVFIDRSVQMLVSTSLSAGLFQ